MSKSYPVPTICRNCFYRRSLEHGGFPNGKNGSHACLYNIIEGELRGSYPTDTECDKFKPRSIRTKGLTGRHEIIK